MNLLLRVPLCNKQLLINLLFWQDIWNTSTSWHRKYFI
jgi:hypothetical protein